MATDAGSGRELDVVLLGATGFVGRLTAAHLARAAGPGVRVALGGRSRARLEALREGLGEPARHWELAEVDAADPVGLHRLAARTTALATTVGPYARDGREVAGACADEGTHYADLTGEVLFVRWTLDTLDDRARRSGARLVHSCGFDSIPSDLGVLLAARRAEADGAGTLTDTTLVVRSLRGGISGGTIDSARQQAILAGADPRSRRLLADPHALAPCSAGVAARTRLLQRDAGTGHWLGPFVMADYNTRIVFLSSALAGGYGPGFRYRELLDLGGGPSAPLVAAGMAMGLRAAYAGLSWTPTRALLDRLLPRPGEGPSEARMAAGRFRMDVTAATTSGARYRTTIAADRDPGYGGTAVMLGESVLSLALDEDRLPARAGVLTPASGLGETLAHRLRVQGFTFDVERIG